MFCYLLRVAGRGAEGDTEQHKHGDDCGAELRHGAGAGSGAGRASCGEAQAARPESVACAMVGAAAVAWAPRGGRASLWRRVEGASSVCVTLRLASKVGPSSQPMATAPNLLDRLYGNVLG
jgi:hypothetical protein